MDQHGSLGVVGSTILSFRLKGTVNEAHPLSSADMFPQGRRQFLVVECVLGCVPKHADLCFLSNNNGCLEILHDCM